MRSGVGLHILSATGGTWTNPCNALRAAWLKHGASSRVAYHGYYNAWAAQLGCTPFNKVPPNPLNQDDLADIALLRKGRVTPSGTIQVAPPPQGGPPESNVQQSNQIRPGIREPEAPVSPQTGFIPDINKITQWCRTTQQISAGDLVRTMLRDGDTKNDLLGDRLIYVAMFGGPSNAAASALYSKVGGKPATWCAGIGGGSSWRVYVTNGPDISSNPDKNGKVYRVVRSGNNIGLQQVQWDEVVPGTGTGTGTGTGPGGGGFGLEELLGPGTEPTMTQRRTCPPQGTVRMRLATNSKCYPRALLPREFWMSPEQKSPFTARDKANIRKAKAALRRVKTAAKDLDLLERPRRRRRARAEHEHEHHTHHHHHEE